MGHTATEEHSAAGTMTGRRQGGGDAGILRQYVEETTTKPTNLARVCGTVIDIHCHTAGIGAGFSGCFISPNLLKSWKYKAYLHSFGVRETELLQHGDQLVLQRLAASLTAAKSVDVAVVLAMDGALDSKGALDQRCTEMYIPNDFLAEAVKQHTNLRFGASINPHRKDALEQLDKAVTAGAVLMKWLPSIQQIDPADKRLVPFYQRLQQIGRAHV